MTLLVSIDPGMETGVVLGRYEAGVAFEVIQRIQVPGGLQGALFELDSLIDDRMEITCEKFSPRPGARSWRLDELEPIRIEGALEDRYQSRVVWRKPEQRKLIGDIPRTGEFLRASGYWTAPKEVGRKDANDVNAAMMHAIGYLRDRAHRPTINMLIEYGEQMTEGLV